MVIREHFTMYYTLLRREVVRLLRIWPQTLLPSVITAVLYFFIFGNILGKQIHGFVNITYIEFITPGLLTMSVVNNAHINVVSSFYSNRFTKSIEELLASPVNNHIVILGYISGGIIRGAIVGSLVFAVAFWFGGFSQNVHSFFLVFLSLFFCSILFSLTGLLNGVFAQKFDDTTIFSTFILTPLTYLGGVFYDIDFLPPVWQTIAKFNPLFYIVDSMRYAFLGYSSVNFFTIIIVVTFSIIICYYLILRLLNFSIIKT